jgi:hypothetical protein
MNIEITDYNHAGEWVTCSYFLNSEATERTLDVEFESLVEHCEYEGLNEQTHQGVSHDGEAFERDVYFEPIAFTDDNLKDVLESYLTHYHKHGSK